MAMGRSRLCTLLIGAGATLALGTGGSVASAASGQPAAPATAVATAATVAGAHGSALGGAWGTALEVPGIAALNQGGDAQTVSVSCVSAGNCGVGGYYVDSSGNYQAFVVNQTHGTWGTAEEVPGTASLNQGGDAGVGQVSCASAGNCSAGGHYVDSSGSYQAFVVSETHGAWGTAEEVPGTAALNQGGSAGVHSVSCASAGNCSAGGYYTDSSGGLQAFVVSETGGTWRKAEEVPGTSTLNQSGDATLASVSCVSVGNCSAGGYYTDSSGNGQVFVVNETGGSWGTAEEVPGTAGHDQGGFLDAQVESVSCASAGNCSAVGTYAGNGTGDAMAFVVNETHGTWGTAEEVPGTAALAQDGLAQGFSVSCRAPGDCSAGGSYADGSGHGQAFVVSETGGTWRKAEEVPGTAALNQDGLAATDSVSCASAGNCSAAGSYKDGSGKFQAFVVSETDGTWRSAQVVPGTAALNRGGDAVVNSVSCASPCDCTAGGYYTDGSGHSQAFVVSRPA
jgi:hypothetical protein